MPKPKIWRLAQANPGLQEVLAREIGISKIVAQVLINRGVLTIEEARAFLHNGLKDLYDPFLLKDMDMAVQIILQAIANKAKIVVFGDYDVDGITSTVLLVRVIREMGGQAAYYFPDRLKEGYGLNKGAIQSLAQQGCQLMITVDCGISCPEEVALALQLGLEVVVTDHHEPPEVLPPAQAVINPKQRDCSYPFKELAGVGIAFKLAQGLRKITNPLDTSKPDYLDLTALGTIADIVPLKDENRILVKYGIPAIMDSSVTGLKALLEVCGLTGKELTPGQVGFNLAPRLNAAGRMGNASLAAELLLTDDANKAMEIAQLLHEANTKRQKREEEITQDALTLIEHQENSEDSKIIVLASDQWHSGIIGIVASRLVEKYYRPVILIAIEDGIGKGSGRSIPGFNLHQALTIHQHYLDKFGGHHQAAGFSINPDQISAFARALQEYAAENISPEMLVPQLELDAIVDLQEVNFDLLAELELLAPFGYKNPGPTWACQAADVLQCQGVGNNGAHLKFKVRTSKGPLAGIGFNLGHCQDELAAGAAVDLAFSVDKNTWQGRTSLQMVLKDIKPAEEKIHSGAGNGQNYLIKQLYEEAGQWLVDFDGYGDKDTTIKVPKVSLQKVHLIDEREHPRKHDYLTNLLAKDEPVLIYVASPVRAVEIAALLRHEKQEDRVRVIYGHNGLDPQNKAAVSELVSAGKIKALVATPAFMQRELKFPRLAHIIICDLPLNWAQFSALTRTQAGIDLQPKIHLLFGSKDIAITEALLTKRTLDRDFLGRFYLSLKNLGKKNNLLSINEQELASYLDNQNSFRGAVRSGIFGEALTILEELNLIAIQKKDTGTNIELLPAPAVKLNLEQSTTFNKGYLAKNMFQQFHQLVLNTPLDTLINLLKTSI